LSRALRKTLSAVAHPFGLEVVNRHEYDRLQEHARLLTEIYTERLSWGQFSPSAPLACVAFSMDRALQLHALLSSYAEKVASPAPVQVLWRASNAAHTEAYREVAALSYGVPVRFVKQTSGDEFRSDFLALLDSLDAEKVFFLVDDIVFTEDVDLSEFSRFDTDRYVPTLRMGTNLRRCYTQQKQQPLPAFLQDPALSGEMICWKWQEGCCDWGYPLSVDGHLFSTAEFRAIVRRLPFYAPNTMESNLQRFASLFNCRRGVAYAKSRIVNIPCNKVQGENQNIHGDVHQNYLCTQWHKGLQMDYWKLYGCVNESAHQELAITLIPR